MANSQCLPHYTTKYLKDDCQPVGNGAQIFTDYRPSQVSLVNNMLNGYKTNHQLRKHMIDSGNNQRKNNECRSVNSTRCHYMNIPEKCNPTK